LSNRESAVILSDENVSQKFKKIEEPPKIDDASKQKQKGEEKVDSV
jgi:hypothetical protein